jgi:hypothetical protein
VVESYTEKRLRPDHYETLADLALEFVEWQVYNRGRPPWVPDP